jgi:hypothetical protein
LRHPLFLLAPLWWRPTHASASTLLPHTPRLAPYCYTPPSWHLTAILGGVGTVPFPHLSSGRAVQFGHRHYSSVC